MAVGSGVPLNGPGPPEKSRRYVLAAHNRKSQAQSSRLEVSATLIRALFDRQSRPEQGRTLQDSNRRPFDTVTDLLRQCISALVLESSDRESSLVCNAIVSDFREGNKVLQGRLNARQKRVQSVFLSTTCNGGLEAGLTSFGIEKQYPKFLTVDNLPGSVAKTLAEQLKKTSNPGDDSSISDLSTFRRTYGYRQVKFQWLKAGNVDDSVGNDSLGVNPSSNNREDEVLSLQGRAVLHQNSHTESCEGFKTPKGTARGWGVVKAGMERVLGRSFLPAQKYKVSNISPPSVVPVEETAGVVANSTSAGLAARNRGCLSSVLAKNGAGPDTRLQGATVPADFFNNADVGRQGPNTSPLSGRMGNNAMAGALAGTCVSLCLHPVDTVKTVIQARSFGQRSVFHTLVAILSNRGVSGLYRGLGSNLASSAPISAIYTFTYESIKASLLPHLPEEYHALAHCAAGGCASIATSVVYTPSECVKQRMQVGSLYRNSWLAFLGILKNGGLSVLYSGWGAVLCRNVPQSVIKFYTYEGLKHYALNWHPVGTSLSTWQTLVFGGLAGSTAALFTTPFDVIKTRLQTQVPGSVMYHKGVVQAFQHIAASEGIGGLYRGLIPRLVIYISQGALFFASYEFFKQVLAELSINSTQSHSQGTVSQAKVVEST